MEQTHECEFIDDEVNLIYKKDGKWWFNIHNDEAETVIWYCPYCAEHLE